MLQNLELYVKDQNVEYPGTRISPDDPDIGSSYNDIADFEEEWGGRKFEWRGIRVRVKGDTRIKEGEPPYPRMRVLSVRPI